MTKPATKHDGRDNDEWEGPIGFLFGHYDSRGGATLVVARRLSQAAARYEAAFGDEPGAIAAYDFLGALPVLSYGAPLPDSGEALVDYGGAFRAFRLHPADEHGEPWNHGLVLVVDGQEPPSAEQVVGDLGGTPKAVWALEDVTETLGEDAFGLMIETV